MNVHQNARLTPQGRLLEGCGRGERSGDFGAAELSLAGALPERRCRGVGRLQLGTATLQAPHRR